MTHACEQRGCPREGSEWVHLTFDNSDGFYTWDGFMCPEHADKAYARNARDKRREAEARTYVY